MNVTVINHPLVRHKLTLMREADCSTYKFRTLTTELARLMAYEASRDFEIEKYIIDGWCGQIEGDRIKGKTLTVVPILRAGGSMVATIDLLKAKGCKNIKALVLVAAPEGVKAVNEAHPDVTIYTAALDSHLNENGYIIPGLGDAGDKIFGTR